MASNLRKYVSLEFTSAPLRELLHRIQPILLYGRAVQGERIVREIQAMISESSEHHPVKHPSHYQGDGIEAMEVVEAFGLCWHLGNAFKYISRCYRKGKPVEDLEKAIFCIQREIELIKKGRQCHHQERTMRTPSK